MTYGEQVKRLQEKFGEDLGGNILMIRDGNIQMVAPSQVAMYEGWRYVRFTLPKPPSLAKKAAPKAEAPAPVAEQPTPGPVKKTTRRRKKKSEE